MTEGGVRMVVLVHSKGLFSAKCPVSQPGAGAWGRRAGLCEAEPVGTEPSDVIGSMNRPAGFV